MGKGHSKAADDQEEVEESKLYDRKKIYIDQFGNFCLGIFVSWVIKLYKTTFIQEKMNLTQRKK